MAKHAGLARTKRQKGTNAKTSPLKRFKKQVKRMNHRLKDEGLTEEKKAVYEARLAGAEGKIKAGEKGAANV